MDHINDNFLDGLPQSILGGAPHLGWYQKEGPDMLPAELQQNFLIPKVAASGAKSRAVGGCCAKTFILKS